MAYGTWREKRTRKSRVEIIPLIDVMFLLLCFFVFASVNMVAQQGIFVDLAASSSSEPLSDTQTNTALFVSINKDGQYYLNRRRVSRDRMIKVLETTANDPRRKDVIIQADEAVPHGMVMGLLDLVRLSGIEHAAFAVEPEE